MMTATAQPFDLRLSRATYRFWAALALLGTALLVLGFGVAPQRTAANLLLLSCYLIGLGVGAAFFIALQYLCGASWAVALRRVPEALCAALALGAVGLAIVLLARPALYPWFDPAPEMAAPLTGFKRLWLQRPFFLARAAAYLAVWLLLARGLVKASRRQDADGDPAHTGRNIRRSAAFMVLFAVTFWLASFDWIMSLEPRWYSTIFGVYNFAGSFLSVLALLVVLVIWLARRGPLCSILTPEHLHDLGKLLVAFSTFWMYIWFSQYMLIWYANIPEETEYFIRRQHGAWAPLVLLNLFLNWVVPFFALLPRRAKRSASVMLKIAAVLLVGRWLDLYLMILPPVIGAGPPFTIWELGALAGGGGVFVLVLFRALRAAPLVPAKDPLLQESLHYHQ